MKIQDRPLIELRFRMQQFWPIVPATTLLCGTLLLGWGCAMIPQQTSPRDPFVTVEPGLAPQRQARPDYSAPRQPMASPQTVPVPTQRPQPAPRAPSQPTPLRTPPKTFADPPPRSSSPPARKPDPFSTEKKPLPTAPVQPPVQDGPKLSPPEDDLPAFSTALPTTKPDDSIDLAIDVPDRRPVGSGAPFQLTIKNVGDRTLRNVSVVCEFDEAFTFPGSTRKSVTHKIPKIESGDAKGSLLTLVSDVAGVHECRFTVNVGSQTLIDRTARVEFVSRQLDWQLHGPTERTVGSRAEFNIPLINITNRELRNVIVRVDLDAALTIREMTQGGRLGDRSVTWSIDRLTANEGMLLQLEVECRESTTQACLTAIVSGDDVPLDDAEACLVVKPVTGLLDVRVVDVTDPIGVDGEAELAVTISNPGLQAAKEVSVECEWPDGFDFVRAERIEQGRSVPIKATVRQQSATLALLPRLEPDVRKEIYVHLQARRPGPHQLIIRVSETSRGDAIEVREPIMVHR